MEEKWELHIQTVFVFYSSRKDKKLSYGGFKIYIQERKDRRQKLDTGIFLPQSNVVTRSSTDTTQIFTGGAAISSSENEKIPDKDTFYALYIVFYIRLPTQRIIMFDRRRQSLCRFSVSKIGCCYYIEYFTHLVCIIGFFFVWFRSMPMGLEKYTTTTTHIDTPHRKQQHTLLLRFMRLSYSISTSGIALEFYLGWSGV